MRPGLRLAISNLSERRSRTALLVATVALCAALIAAVACAMDSVQRSARDQVAATVGLADATIQTASSGLLPETLLDQVRGWPEVRDARGVFEVPLSLSYTMRVLARPPGGEYRAQDQPARATAIAVASTDLASGSSGLRLLAGRAPTADGEVVLDASAARWFSARGQQDSNTKLGVGIVAREVLDGPAPMVPESVSAPELADAINARVGLRVGDTIQVSRQALPQVNISAVLSDPIRAAEMAKAAGAALSFSKLAEMMRRPGEMKVVGIAEPPPLGGRFRVYTTTRTVNKLLGESGKVSKVELFLNPGVDAEAFVQGARARLPGEAILQTSAKVTARFDKQIESSRLGFLLATMMAFFAAGFIIATAMTTGVSERTRELGILRCIGADPGQLARAQILAGGTIGAMGALLGVPLGIAAALALVRYLRDLVDISPSVPWWGVLLAGGGALLAGVMGSAFPAWSAARVSPLQALAIRSRQPRLAMVLRLLVLGVLALVAHVAIVTLTRDGQWRFWLYITLGIPLHFVGYFALSVPATLLVARGSAGAISSALGLPRHVLGRTIRATPYRFGFTAGSMMLGLSLLVGIWTQGSSIERDWLGKLEFPDAFVTGLNLSEQSQRRVEQLPFVRGTCALTLQPVQTGSFGVHALHDFSSTFIAFEPEPFFQMVNPVWVEGDLASALEKLRRGNAIIIAREFMIARDVHVGDTITLRANTRSGDFEVVGVVTSPGLELVSQFFNIGEDFSHQSMHAVFGTRDDLRRHFASDAVHLIQIALAPGTDDAHALEQLRATLDGAGILDIGSGRMVKEQIARFVRHTLLAFSLVAVGAMLIAGLGVANLIIAGILARQYEFGVLQAVGASRGLVARLVLAEALIVALGASLLGTLMGAQGVFAVQQIDRLLFGLELSVRIPPRPLLIGWAVTIAMTLLAAAPAVLWLSRRRPRELLSAIR